MNAANQNPEQIARDKIDALLEASGWVVQPAKKIDLSAGLGVAVREYQTDVGPVDYALFVDKKAVGVIEAKPEDWGHRITTVEEQSGGYANATLKYVKNKDPLPFVYESTGAITRFTDGRDPKPRSREVFTFHRPETLQEWISQQTPLRARLHTIPPLDRKGLRDCQINAIQNLEKSFKADKPRALIQMATGAGKTFTAITSVYRLLKFANAKRVLFLVDTKNLGVQAEQEFMTYVPNDDNRKFTELYNVQRLKSSHVPRDAQVCISTIQRMYSILKGEELDEAAEEANPAEQMTKPKKPMPVVYNPKIPPEFFDFIVIDECHRSIYNVWQQVLDYFDASLIGLTATPDARTYGFFKKNIVSEYTHERAVADGVNVGNEIYVIETERTRAGGTIRAEQQVERRERLTRKKRWERQDEDEVYTANQLDRDIVNPDQIRTVIRTFKEKLPEIFPGRKEVPKTLIFAKTDSHADDIIQTVREEFGEGNDFCRKITHKGIENLKTAREQLKVYRQAVLKYAFEGKLTIEWREKNKRKREPIERLLKHIQFEEKKKLEPVTIQEIEKNEVIPPDWKYVRLGCFIDAIETGKSFKCDEREPDHSEIGVAKVSAVTWGEYDEAESKTCLDPTMVNTRLFIQLNDFLFSRANTIEFVGACVIAKKVTKQIMLSDKTLRIKFHHINPYYFLFYLRSQAGRNEIMQRSTGNQDSMRNIGQDRIRNIVVPVCSSEEAEYIQLQIQERFSIIDKLQETIDFELKKSETLRQSILKKAFSGQLVAQNPKDEPASVLLERISAEKESLKAERKFKSKRGAA